MSETAIVSIILGVLGLMGGGGFFGYRQFKKEAPVKKRDADIVAAGTNVQMAISIATAAQTHSEGLAQELKAEREARQQLSGRLDGLETHIRELNGTIRLLRDAVRIFSAAWDDIEIRWHEYRLSNKPPPRPHTQLD